MPDAVKEGKPVQRPGLRGIMDRHEHGDPQKAGQPTDGVGLSTLQDARGVQAESFREAARFGLFVLCRHARLTPPHQIKILHAQIQTFEQTKAAAI